MESRLGNRTKVITSGLGVKLIPVFRSDIVWDYAVEQTQYSLPLWSYAARIMEMKENNEPLFRLEYHEIILA